MKPISLMIPVVLLWACAHKPIAQSAASSSPPSKTTQTDTVLVYRSAANGSADLALTMLSNHTFSFFVQTIPVDDPKAVNANLGGIWKDVGEGKRLFFNNNNPLLKELFDSLGAQKREFTIINDSVVDINDQLSGIFIGGILCEKKKRRLY